MSRIGPQALAATRRSTLAVLAVIALVGCAGTLLLAYVRSLDVAVAFDIQQARQHDVTIPSYGALDPGTRGVFESLQPGLAIGFAF